MTWEKLSEGRFCTFSDIIGSEFESLSALELDQQRSSWLNPMKLRFTELQLHQIKTGLSLIEGLWRDFSLGTNHVVLSQFNSVHKYLKEIGKELFSGIFMKENLPNQVFRPINNYHLFFVFELELFGSIMT